jgi:hypothetical protein
MLPQSAIPKWLLADFQLVTALPFLRSRRRFCGRKTNQFNLAARTFHACLLRFCLRELIQAHRAVIYFLRCRFFHRCSGRNGSFSDRGRCVLRLSGSYTESEDQNHTREHEHRKRRMAVCAISQHEILAFLQLSRVEITLPDALYGLLEPDLRPLVPLAMTVQVDAVEAPIMPGESQLDRLLPGVIPGDAVHVGAVQRVWNRGFPVSIPVKRMEMIAGADLLVGFGNVDDAGGRLDCGNIPPLLASRHIGVQKIRGHLLFGCCRCQYLGVCLGPVRCLIAGTTKQSTALNIGLAAIGPGIGGPHRRVWRVAGQHEIFVVVLSIH